MICSNFVVFKEMYYFGSTNPINSVSGGEFMSTTETKQFESLLSNDLKVLMHQESLIKRRINKLSLNLFNQSTPIRPTPPTLSRKIYVARLPNKRTLRESIHNCMVVGRETTIQEVLAKVNYKTDSKYFYTMVDNKLNDDPLIERIAGARGVFILHRNKNWRKGRRGGKSVA